MKKLVLSVVALGGMLATAIPASANTYPDGDANCSGTVTMADANLVLATYFQKPNLPAVPGECGAKVDMNCDGNLTHADALLIQRAYLGFEVPEAC